MQTAAKLKFHTGSSGRWQNQDRTGPDRTGPDRIGSDRIGSDRIDKIRTGSITKFPPKVDGHQTTCWREEKSNSVPFSLTYSRLLIYWVHRNGFFFRGDYRFRRGIIKDSMWRIIVNERIDGVRTVFFKHENWQQFFTFKPQSLTIPCIFPI